MHATIPTKEGTRYFSKDTCCCCSRSRWREQGVPLNVPTWWHLNKYPNKKQETTGIVCTECFSLIRKNLPTPDGGRQKEVCVEQASYKLQIPLSLIEFASQQGDDSFKEETIKFLIQQLNEEIV